MSNSDIADGIIPEKIPEHISPRRTQFQPWHKVRKQFIRKHQWNVLARKLIKQQWRSELERLSSLGAQESLMNASKPLKCLMIPGDDLLDIQALWEDVTTLDCVIRYIGFNETGGSNDSSTNVHIANNRVTGLAGVVKSSEVHHDRFEAIANIKSQAFRNLNLAGPYHIVNLDLCSSIFPNTVKDSGQYYAAIHRLLIYQFEKQKVPWLLFVTTYVNASAAHLEQFSKLCKPTKENISKHSTFAEKSEALFPRSVFEGETDLINLNGLSDSQTINLFGTAFGKWLLQLGQSSSPKWSVSMHGSYRYSINDENGAVMLSLAYEMTPNFSPPGDPTGMSTIEVSTKPARSELDCAIQIVKSMESVKDVDELLLRKPALYNELINSATLLMETAGYDGEAYKIWANFKAE